MIREADAIEDGPYKEAYLALVEYQNRVGWTKMAEITPLFVNKLKEAGFPSLTIDYLNMPDETHLSVIPGAMSRGIRYVLGGWRP